MKKVNKEVWDLLHLQTKNFFEKKGVQIQNEAHLLEKSASPSHGDITISLPLKYKKECDTPPLKIAEELAKELSKEKKEDIQTITVKPPGFVNISFSDAFLRENTKFVNDEKKRYGSSNALHKKKIVVEHTSPNPNKAMHIGHLRNNLIGNTIVRLFKNEEGTVYADAVDNNRGIAIQKAVWGFLNSKRKEKGDSSPQYWSTHKEKWYTPKEEGIDESEFVN